MPDFLQSALVPASNVPSTFLEHLNARRGDRLQPVAAFKQPVYEQERFERRMFRAYARITGTGAALGSYTFEPTWDAFPHSLRINRISILNEATAPRRWQVLRHWQTLDGNSRYLIVANMTIEAGTFGCLIDNFAHMYNTNYRQTGFVGSPFNLWRFPTRGLQFADTFSVASTTNITNADVIDINIEGDVIPDAADLLDLSALGTIAP